MGKTRSIALVRLQKEMELAINEVPQHAHIVDINKLCAMIAKDIKTLNEPPNYLYED